MLPVIDYSYSCIEQCSSLFEAFSSEFPLICSIQNAKLTRVEATWQWALLVTYQSVAHIASSITQRTAAQHILFSLHTNERSIIAGRSQ